MKNILKKPLVSEKSFAKVSENKFTFIIDDSSSKDEVRAAVQDLFNVTVLSINTINIPGKIKKGKKGFGRRSDVRKAILTLKKGDKIDLFEVETEDKGKSKSKVQSPKSKEKEVKEDKDTTVKVREKKK